MFKQGIIVNVKRGSQPAHTSSLHKSAKKKKKQKAGTPNDLNLSPELGHFCHLCCALKEKKIATEKRV
jgi:hypothetical protein